MQQKSYDWLKTEIGKKIIMKTLGFHSFDN
jgi:hypothetical protein